MPQTIEAKPAVRHDLKVGGNYVAEDNGDGTYNILDVPIFAEIPAGVKRNADPVGREWQEAAVLKNKAREAEGHLPPVHIYHTDEKAVKPIYAGKMRLRDVRRISYEGNQLWATFADILGVPAEVFQKIKRGFLPYRSVEIHNWDKPEIDSLALMDTDVPFFRMPMLSISQVVLQKDANMFMDRTRPCAVVFRAAKKSNGGAMLFRFNEGGQMPDEDEDKDKDQNGALNAPPADGETEAQGEADLDEKASGEARKGPGGAEMADSDESPDAEKPEAILGEDEEKSDAGDSSSKEIMSTLKALTGQMQSIGTLMQKVLERLGPAPAPQEKLGAVTGADIPAEANGQEFKSDNDPVKFDTKEDGMADKDKATDVQELVAKAAEAAVLKATAPLMAKLSALEQREAEREKGQAAEARFNSAMKELTDNGHIVSEELQVHLRKAAQHDEALMKDLVATFRASLPKEPPADASDFESELSAQESAAVDNDVVNQFVAEHGPKYAQFAREQLKAYEAAAQSGAANMTAEDWLSTNFRAYGHKVKV